MIKEYATFPQITVENFNYKLTKEEFSTNPFLKILIYEQAKEPIAFLLYSKIYDRYEIEQFEVQEKYRNQHFGSALLEYLISKAIKEQIKNITLEVDEYNIKAINLYQKYDFKKVAERKNYYSGKNGILMERKI